MQKSGWFGSLCFAAVIATAVMSLQFGEWGLWIPVLGSLACAAAPDMRKPRAGPARCRPSHKPSAARGRIELPMVSAGVNHAGR